MTNRTASAGTATSGSGTGANKENPFFLYVPHPIPHRPLHVSPEFMPDVPPETNAKGRGKDSGPVLFDLEADISEKKNVLQTHPEVAKRLRFYIESFEKKLAQNSRPAAFADDPQPLTMQK